MYHEPATLEHTKAEVMEEVYSIDGNGTEVVWVTFPDGLTVSMVRDEKTPDKVVVRGWNHEDDGPVFKKSLEWKEYD